MLTVKQIIKLCEEGVDFVVLEECVDGIIMCTLTRDNLRGEWDSEELIVIVYLKPHQALKDIYETMVHELIHARNDLLRDIEDDEDEVEEEALRTVEKHPEYFKFIVDLFKLDMVYITQGVAW